MTRRLLFFALCLALAACGNKQRLHPPANASLPPKPAMSPRVPTAEELLKQQPSERPARSDELLTKSEARPDDPFDQPPK